MMAHRSSLTLFINNQLETISLGGQVLTVWPVHEHDALGAS
jgi:hypothetical protein